MYARLIFSLGGTKPGPPRTCRGTIANVVAAAPLASMNLRRERPKGRGWLVVSFVFIRFTPSCLESVPKVILQSLCRHPLSENFVEIGHFQRNFDKVFRQRLTTKSGMSLLGQALTMINRDGFSVLE